MRSLQTRLPGVSAPIPISATGWASLTDDPHGNRFELRVVLTSHLRYVVHS